jgi:glycine dehydrogenase subunit 2
MNTPLASTTRPKEPCGATAGQGRFGLIFERGAQGHRGYRLAPLDIDCPPAEQLLPDRFLRQAPPQLPEVTEPEVVRHYVALSALNHHVDRSLYPLGSCTMKYNPKINEDVARIPRFAGLHPDAPESLVQGILELMWGAARDLAAITGMHAVSLQPAAGAQGEMLGMLLFRAYHDHHGNAKSIILIPDSAHGTNPASVALCGFRPQKVASGEDGRVDLRALREAVTAETAGIMITNPSTLGLFEREVAEIAACIHDVDGLVYMDGANLNALMGLALPGTMGVDAVHLNLHKTFSTPHGGGGPGAGPVGVSAKLIPFLPVPLVERGEEDFRLVTESAHAVGKLHPYYGNVGVIVRAAAYIASMGSEGLSAASRAAIVNANYLMKLVDPIFPVAKQEACMHEFVSSLAWTRKHGVTNIDVAKRLLDYGFHAPTVSFPLIVPDAFMIEPTETETRAALDRFAAALGEIAREVRENPDLVRTAPHATPVGRLDEAAAARQPKTRWRAPEGSDG